MANRLPALVVPGLGDAVLGNPDLGLLIRKQKPNETHDSRQSRKGQRTNRTQTGLAVFAARRARPSKRNPAEGRALRITSDRFSQILLLNRPTRPLSQRVNLQAEGTRSVQAQQPPAANRQFPVTCSRTWFSQQEAYTQSCKTCQNPTAHLHHMEMVPPGSS